MCGQVTGVSGKVTAAFNSFRIQIQLLCMLDVQDRSKNQKQYLKVFFAEGQKEKKPTHLESFIGHVGNKLLRNQRNQFCDLRNDFNAVIDDSQKKV